MLLNLPKNRVLVESLIAKTKEWSALKNVGGRYEVAIICMPKIFAMNILRKGFNVFNS